MKALPLRHNNQNAPGNTDKYQNTIKHYKDNLTGNINSTFSLLTATGEEVRFTWLTDQQKVVAYAADQKEGSSQSGNKKSDDCTICKVDQITYDNELLNHPELVKFAIQNLGSRAIDLSTKLSPDLIEAASYAQEQTGETGMNCSLQACSAPRIRILHGS